MLNIYCKQTNASLWRVRRNKDILYYPIHSFIHSFIRYLLILIILYGIAGNAGRDGEAHGALATA